MKAVWWALVFLAYCLLGALFVVLSSLLAYALYPGLGVAGGAVLGIAYLVGLGPVANWTIDRSV